MAEIYRKPFESVQAAITLFEQKVDPKYCSNSSNKEDCSLLLEAGEHEKNLSFLEFDASSKSPEELLTLLKLYKAERDDYKEKFRKSQALFLEYEKGDSLKADELRANIEAKNMPEAKVLRRQFDGMEDLENEVLKQIIMSEYLHVELKQSKEALSICSKAALSAMNDLNLVKPEKEQLKQVNSENKWYIFEIEEEGKRMQEETSDSRNKELEQDETASIKDSAFINANSDGFRGITISMEEYELLIRKSDMASGAKSEPTDAYEVDKLRRELEEKNAEISKLKCVLEETEERAAFAEEAKLVVEAQLRRWRDQRRLRRAASDAVKEYCATQNEAQKRHEKPLLSKLGCINLETDAIPSPAKRTFSMQDRGTSKRTQLGKLLKIKF